MNIDVVICCVELVAIVFKFYTCELLDMNNGVDYDVKLVVIVIEMFCTYLELNIDIDVVICCDELVAIMFKFCTCELLDMDNGVDYDVKLVAIVLIFHVNT